ncbi:HWE histidine kinase domain-containing protein [Bradyrhizobium sp. U531]|uniref:sensor histidine kinase n=1 Tax=Bradyrhizobium sp. U531 TaxID=3053458 RepID=UPI003F423323
MRTYLTLFALALILPVLAVSFFGLNRMAAIEQSQIERRVMQIAQNLRFVVDRELDRALVTLETLATSSELRSGNLGAFHQQAVLALKPKKAAIVLIDTAYRQLVDTLKPYGAELPPTSDPVTAQRVIDTGKPQISNLFKGSVNGLPVFNVEVPVFDDEKRVRYVLIMSFQAAFVADVLAEVRLDPAWLAGVTGSDGNVIARSQQQDEYVGRPLPAELFEQTRNAERVYPAVNIAGERILRATAMSERAPWFISATVPLSHTQEPYDRSLFFAVILVAVALVLSGSLAYVFARLMARPLDEATHAAAAVGRGEDVHARRTSLVEANVLIDTLAKASAELNERAQHSDFLMRELVHRAKNQLAVVKGMALQTARESATVNEFIGKFDRRILGLAQSQDLLLRQNWRGAWLRDLVHAHLELFGVGPRARIYGPDIFLDTTAVQNVGFALHELATNASKYGALSNEAGRLAVVWQALEDSSVRVIWSEHDGPPPRREQEGFGHRVITDLVPRALNGSSKLEFTPQGVRWELTIPADHIVRRTDHQPLQG